MFTMELKNENDFKIETVITLYKNILYGNKNFLSCAFIITDGTSIYSISSGGMVSQHP